MTRLRRLARLWCCAGAWLCAVLATVRAADADPPKIFFGLPEGDAAVTLRQFSEQARTLIVYPIDVVRGVPTNPVHGDFTARSALDRMVAGTELIVAQDERSGALTVGRPALPPGNRRLPSPAPTSLSNSPPSRNVSLPVKNPGILNLLAGWLAAGATADAQSATPPAREEAVVLTPFTVNAANDTSWTATTTLVGSRTNQELARLPATVDVITADFMRDLGLFSMEDAAQFVSGMQVAPRLESRNDDGRITYRGLSNVGYSSRNFFIWYVPTDSYNVDRFDFSKGSNSLLFGESSPGGQTNINTKRAVAKNFEEVFANYGSFGTYRAQLDINRALTRNFFLRFNAVDRSNRTYLRGSHESLRAADLVLTWQPWKDTSIRAELERGRQQRARADSGLLIFDGAAPGRGFSTNNVWYYTSDQEIFYRTATFPDAVDRAGTSGNQVSLLAGQERSVRLPDGTSKLFKGFDKYTNVLGPNDYSNHTFNVATFVAEQRVGKLSLEAAYNQQFRHLDKNDSSFGTGGSPPALRVDSRGRPYVDQPAGGSNYKIFGNIVKTGRLAAAYPFDFGRWGKQFAVVTLQRQRDFASFRRFGMGNERGPGLIGNNQVVLRAYVDDPRITDGTYWDQFLLENLPTTPSFKAVNYENYTSTGPFFDIRYLSTRTASLSGEYFGGRLNSLIGASWNSLSRKIPGPEWYTTDARGYVKYPGKPSENPGAFVYDQTLKLTTRSTMIGLTGVLLRKEQATVNVYGVLSESFNFQSRQTFFGPDLGPVRGETKEVGLKGDLFQRKLSYTLAAYDIRRQNVQFAWSPDVLPLIQLEDLMNPNDILPADPRYARVTDGPNNERRTVNSSEHSRGIDLTLQGQRWHGLQTRVTFSATRVRSSPDFSKFKSYLEAAIARTNAANAPSGNPAMAESPVIITNAQTIIGANSLTNAISGRRSAPFGASFALDYDARAVRGLRLGLNGWLTPDYNIAISNGVIYKGAAMFPTGCYVLFDRRIANRPFTFRLSVQNLYDLINGDSPYRITGSSGTNAATAKPNYIYRYAEPITWNLSMTVRL